MAIYLFKAARRPTYRRENLHLLAADRGTVVDAQYRMSWVAPEYFEPGSIQRGEEVHVIFTDRPYERFVPVRSGEVFDVIRGDGVLRLRLLVNNWIGLPADMSVEDFTRIVKQTHPEKAPRHKFLAPKLDRITFHEYFDEREDEGWCRAIDEVCRMSAESHDHPYAGSVFFRPLGVRLEGEDAPVSVRTRALEPGTRGALELRFHNPHLTEDGAAALCLEATAVGDVRIETPKHLPTCGHVSLPIEVRAPDAEALIQIGPAVTQHTYVVERFGGVRRAAPPGGAMDEAARRRDLLDVVDSVTRNTTFTSDGDRLDFWQLVSRMLPEETRVAEQRALACAALGDQREALRILRELPNDELGDEAALLLWQMELEEGDSDGAADRAQTLGILDDSRFGRFIDVIEGLEPRRLAGFVPRLAELVPADEALRDLVDRVASRMISPDALAATADAIAYQTGDARWAYQFLLERRDALRLIDPVVHDRLLALAADGGTDELDVGTEQDEIRIITNLLQRDEIDEVRTRLDTRAQIKVPGQRRLRDRLFHHAADQLTRRERGEDAARVMVDLGRHACNTGDLQAAHDAVQRAIGLWHVRPNGNGKPIGDLPEWLRDAVDCVGAAWKQVEGLEDWRRADEERQRKQLRDKWLNKRILIAGGLRRPDLIDYLEDMTGAHVDWCERYRDEGSDMRAYYQRLENGQYHLVIHMLRKTGHETAEQLKSAAEKGSARWAQAQTAGRAGVLACLGEE